MNRISSQPLPRVDTVALPEVSVWERFAFEATRVTLRALLHLLSLSGLYRVGQVFGTLEWLVDYKRRRRFTAVARDLFGDDIAAPAIRRACWRHFMRVRNDKSFYQIFDHLPRETIRRRFTIHNRHLIDDALAAGNGAYLAMSHQGSHHIALICLRAAGYAIGAVRDPREGAVRRFMQNKLVTKQWAQVRYFRNDVFPRRLYRWFAENALLVSAMDTVRRHGEAQKTADVTFFNKPRPMLMGPLELAVRCRTPVLQAFVISRQDFHYEFVVHGPLWSPANDPDPTEHDLRALLQTYAERIEAFTRKYPCHLSRI